MTDEEPPWCDGTMLITHFDILRGQLVAVHAGSPITEPPIRLQDRYMWQDGVEDAGIIDWDATGEWPAITDLRETPGMKG